jgi:hypothetical protein
MTDFKTLKFRRRNYENTESSTAVTVRDRAPVLINILLTFYCGNAGDEKRFQTVNGQVHTRYLHFYLHAPHSATMIQLFLHFANLSLRMEKECVMCRPRLPTCPSVCGLTIPQT